MDTIQTTPEIDIQPLIAFIAYMAMIILVGIYASRFSSKGIANFFIGGRKMGSLVVAFSSVVSGRSAWLLLGVTGMAYFMGLSAMWAVLGYTLAELFLFLYYAPRIRRFSEIYDCITVPDFFSERFADKNGALRIVVVSVIILFMIAYVSAQFVAGSKAFHSSFQVTETQGLLITTIIILFYTMLGGFLAVSLTDTIQGFIMIVALIVLPVIVIMNLGGFAEFYRMASAINEGQFFNPMALSTGALIGFLGIGLGSPGNPHIIARYMSINDPKRLKSVALIGTSANVIMALGALTTGMVGRLYFTDVSMLPGQDAEGIYPLMASEHLHPLLFGVIIASVFAAIMSTADSQLLVAASALVRDIYEKLISKKSIVSQKKLVFYSRLTVCILVVFALMLALIAESLIFWLVLFAWAGLGAALGPTSILALFWKKTTKAGVIAGMVSGALCVIIWNRTPALVDWVYELVPAFILGFLVTVVVSLFTKTPDNNDDLWKAMGDSAKNVNTP